MAYTLLGVLNDIAAIIDQDTTLATGSDLTVRVNLINQAQVEWANSYQWKDLRYRFAPSVGYSTTSTALPANFKKLMSSVIDVTLTSSNEYVEISPSDALRKLSTDRYVYVRGNLPDNQHLRINPALVSGVSLVLEYQAYPSSLATLQDVLTCPNPQFISNRVLSQLFAARSDPRFPQYKSFADDELAKMIEEESVPSGGADNRTPDYLTRSGFVIGED